jgi:hypothetical protein
MHGRDLTFCRAAISYSMLAANATSQEIGKAIPIEGGVKVSPHTNIVNIPFTANHTVKPNAVSASKV